MEEITSKHREMTDKTKQIAPNKTNSPKKSPTANKTTSKHAVTLGKLGGRPRGKT